MIFVHNYKCLSRLATKLFLTFFFFLKIQAVMLLWHLNPHLVASALCILMRWWHCLKSSSFNLEVAFQPQMNIIWRCCFFLGWPRWSAPTALCPQTAALPREACESHLPVCFFLLHGLITRISLACFWTYACKHLDCVLTKRQVISELWQHPVRQGSTPTCRTCVQNIRTGQSVPRGEAKKKGDDSMWLDKKKRTGL